MVAVDSSISARNHLSMLNQETDRNSITVFGNHLCGMNSTKIKIKNSSSTWFVEGL